jgi:hypothetical protein
MTGAVGGITMPNIAAMEIVMLEMGIGGGVGGMRRGRAQIALAMSFAYNVLVTEPCLFYHFFFNCNQHRCTLVSHMLLYTLFERHELLRTNVLLDILNMTCNASSVGNALHQLARVT